MRTFAVAIALALLIPGCAQAVSTLPDGARVIDSAAASPEARFEAFDTTKITLYDLDADGDLEAVAHNDNNRVIVLDLVRGRTLAELTTRHPGVWNVRELNDVAVTDLEGDGRPDLVVANSAGWLTRFEMDALASTEDRFAFEKLWEVRVDPRLFDPDYRESHPWIKNGTAPSMDGGAYVADVDRDGVSEIFVQTDGWPGHFSFDADGELRWMNTWSDGNSNPWVTDLDGDGKLEAIYVTDGGRVYAYDAAKGYLLWTFRAQEHGVDPGSISISPGFGDLDGDGRKEIVFATRQAVEDKADPDWMSKQHTMLFAVSAPVRHEQPTLLWNVTYPWLNPHGYTHPAILDVDGDGRLDVLSMDWNTIGHKPGDWERTGDPNLFALDGRDGSLIWRQELESPWNNKDLAVGDADGDGDQEIVLSDPRHGRSALTFRDLRTGEFEGHVPLPWGGMRGPQLADVDGNGALDVVQALSREASGCTRDLDVGCREGAVFVQPLAGSKAAWSGRFTFDHGTETVYSKRGEVPRVVVGALESARGEVSVAVTGKDVESVAVTDGRVVVELERDGDVWRGEGDLAPGTPVEVDVEFADRRVVAPRTVPDAPLLPLPRADPAPTVETRAPPEAKAPPVASPPPSGDEGAATTKATPAPEADGFDTTDLVAALAAVAVLGGLGAVAWILRGSSPKAPVVATLKRVRLWR